MLARAVEVAGMANSKPDEMGNTLYYGDCLEVMEKFLADESIDLIYLDPPFNSNADYNIIFGKQRNGKPAQVTAFGDTWRWGGRGTEDAVLIAGALKHPAHVAVSAFMTLLGECGMMAYLGYMAQRLVVMHSKLKDTGTLYLHCDTTASHYLKVLLDSVFGPQNYLNEISWLRSQPKSHAKVNLSRCRDLILRYGKGPNTVFNKVYGEYDPDYVMKFYRHTDEDGRRYQLADLTNPNPARPNLTYEFMGVHRVWRWTRERMEEARQEGRIVQSKPGAVPRYKRYLDEMRGQPVTDNWDDIEHLHGSNKEKLPYPTQKPVALLERILDLSSNPGDLVLDPFCGCGTTIVAAEKLSRRWVGIDISPVAIDVMTRERRDFPVGNFQIKGVPEDLAGAGKLAESNPYDFQRWAIHRIPGMAANERMSADGGFDGKGLYQDGKEKRLVLAEVKSSAKGVQAAQRSHFEAAVREQNAKMGVFITLHSDPATEKWCKKHGEVKLQGGAAAYPKFQVWSMEDFFEGHLPRLPGLLDIFTGKVVQAEIFQPRPGSAPSAASEEPKYDFKRHLLSGPKLDEADSAIFHDAVNEGES